MKYIDSDYSLGGKLISNIERRTVSSGSYLAGTVVTTRGIVYVHSEENYTVLRMALHGRYYERRFPYDMTKRGLATAAGRFAFDKGMEVAK